MLFLELKPIIQEMWERESNIIIVRSQTMKFWDSILEKSKNMKYW